MKNKKLTIKQLKVKSFVTQLKQNHTSALKGGLSRMADCGHCLTNQNAACV